MLLAFPLVLMILWTPFPLAWAYVFAAVKIATWGLQTQDGSMRAEAHIRFFNLYGSNSPPLAALVNKDDKQIPRGLPRGDLLCE